MSKENKPKKVKKARSGGGIGKFFIALIMAFAVFVALIVLQTGITNKYEKVSVVVAKTEIGPNTDITKDNLSQYFTTTSYDVTKLPSGYIPADKMEELLADSIIITGMPKAQIVTDKNYISKSTVTGQIAEYANDNLVEASFSVDSIADAVAGTVRRGDVVTIIVYRDLEPESTIRNTEKYILEDIHIKQAYDGGGRIVTEADEGVPATLFDIIANRKDIDTLNDLLLEKARGGLVRIILIKTNDVAF